MSKLVIFYTAAVNGVAGAVCFFVLFGAGATGGVRVKYGIDRGVFVGRIVWRV